MGDRGSRPFLPPQPLNLMSISLSMQRHMAEEGWTTGGEKGKHLSFGAEGMMADWLLQDHHTEVQ